MAEGPTDDVLRPESPHTEQVLLQSYQRFLRFLESKVGQRAVAEELLQSAYVRALERGVPEGNEESAVAWFHAVLRNAVVDHFRRTGTERRGLEREAHSQGTPVLELELKEAVCACVRELLPQMKSEYAEMVARVDLDERSVAEVAQALGISPNNANVRLHRARQALKRELQRCCGACAEHGCLECSCQRSKNARSLRPQT